MQFQSIRKYILGMVLSWFSDAVKRILLMQFPEFLTYVISDLLKLPDKSKKPE